MKHLLRLQKGKFRLFCVENHVFPLYWIRVVHQNATDKKSPRKTKTKSVVLFAFSSIPRPFIGSTITLLDR